MIRLLGEMESFQRESRELEENLKKSEEETKHKQEGIQNLKNAMEACEKLDQELQEQKEEKQQQKEEKNTSHKAFFEKRDQLSERTSLLDKECFRLKSQEEKVEEQRENQISYMWEEYEITPNSALSHRKEELNDRQEMKKNISRIKDEIRRLGSVNVNAIEDYKNLLERHTFLSGQYEDLVQAEKTLESIIQELDEGMRRQFAENFMISRENLTSFKELFGGGKELWSLLKMRIFWKQGLRSFPSTGQKTAEYDAAFRRREGSDCHSPSFCYPESETVSVLSSG